MLHDTIVMMRIYAERTCPFKSPFEHTIPYPMHVRQARQTMDNVVRFIIQPRTFIDLFVCRFRSRQKGKVCYHPILFFYYKSAMPLNVRSCRLF